MWLDRNALLPVAKGWRAVVPQAGRDRLRNAFENLEEPLIFANTALQARPTAAATTFWRFLVNSTFGLAGLFDVATDWGLPRQTGDIGQTLFVWGVRESPYLVLPVFGPSTLRDGAGLVGAMVADPTGRAMDNDIASTAIGVASGIDLRARNIETVDELRAGTLDFYATLRSVWLQQRQATLDEALGRSSGLTPDDPGASPPAK